MTNTCQTRHIIDMRTIKVLKDYGVKLLLGKSVVPSGFVELHKYFRYYDPIRFKHRTEDGGIVVSISENFRHGTIITHTRDLKKLDINIKDAILTSFEVPYSYRKEVAIMR